MTSRSTSQSLTDTVCGILAEVLDYPELRVTDDFFQYGGDSLAATRVIASLWNAIGVRLPIVALFEAPTAADLSAWIEEHVSD